MPFIVHSDYVAPRGFRGAHASTILPGVFRRVGGVDYQRERIDTDDGDFLDLDWVQLAPGADRLVIISHGLEGGSNRPYVRGMARAFARNGWDALAWNYRSCSGEMNRNLRFYHSGATDDLERILRHVLRETRAGQTSPFPRPYREIVLVGFSLGGNLTLKYVGERGAKIRKIIRCAVALSTPCDLAACSVRLAQPENRIYMVRFLVDLRRKIEAKAAQFPDQVDAAPVRQMKTFQEFDDVYTAPIHGFRDARHYWASQSSINFIEAVRIPALLINAKNDPFLAPECFPAELAQKHRYFHFESPDHGGHVGFTRLAGDGYFWSELRTLAFVEAQLNGTRTTPPAGRVF
jgi:hypothetical protein